ncbi:hypothetical protein PVAND_008553 [Polypedilum vanderplanki]|uniref:Uncharacterized protein n=1 Tax=Polypedilum vanderplanki TaxID=319348 RepID=A0A9J6CBE6_POLVA|nr:hypothetical protein PVAND_008553 [Polypedilum vanderplanki]
MAFNLYSHFISMNNETIPLVRFAIGNLMPGLKLSEALSISLFHQSKKTIDPSIGGIYFHRGSASKVIFFSTQEYANSFITSIESHSTNQLFYFLYNGNNVSVSSPEVCGEGRISYETNNSNWHDASNLIWSTNLVLSFSNALNLLISNYDNELRYLLLDRGKSGDYAVYLVGFQSNAAGKKFINERKKYNEMLSELNKNLGLEGENLYSVVPQPLQNEDVSMEIDRNERMKKSLSFKEYKAAKYGHTSKSWEFKKCNGREICYCKQCKFKRSKEECHTNKSAFGNNYKRDPDHHHHGNHHITTGCYRRKN